MRRSKEPEGGSGGGGGNFAVTRSRSLPGIKQVSWQSEGGDPRGDPIDEVLSGIVGLQASQKRMEGVLFELQRDMTVMLEHGPSCGDQTSRREPEACSLDSAVRPSVTSRNRLTKAYTKIAEPPPRPRMEDDDHDRPTATAALAGFLEGGLGSAPLLDHEDDARRKPATFQSDPTMEDWPACIELHDCFKEANDRTHLEAAEVRFRMQRSHDTGGLTGFEANNFGNWVMRATSTEETKKLARRCCRLGVIDPDSLFLLPMKVLTTLALVHDLIAIPYILAWDVPIDGSEMNVAEAAVAFWALDIFLTFFTGFYRDGELERHLSVIAKNYTRGWFVPDAVAVLGDFASLMPYVRDYLGRRFVLRTPGLLRVHKINRMFDTMLDRTRTELRRLALQGLKMLLFLMWLNHIVGCAWYSVGINAPSDTGGRWMDTLHVDGVEGFHHGDVTYRYTTCFHWAMGQIVSGGVENLSPVNSYERGFSIMILLFGLVVFSSILSIFNATMTNWTILQQEQTSKMRALREYLGQNDVSQRTSIRVQKQVAERMQTKGRLVEKDVHALLLLSCKLRGELQFEVSGPHLQKHPVFHICTCAHQNTMKVACADSVISVLKMPGDMLFEERTAADKAFFVVRGNMSYTISASVLMEEEDVNEPVEEGAWLCEAALWTRWTHVGLAEAEMNTELVAIKVSRLLFELMKHESIAILVREYAIQFHSRLTEAPQHGLRSPTDLRVPDTGFVELVLGMDANVQSIVGRLSLLDARQKQAITPESLDKLQEELDRKKCAIMYNDQVDELYRAVTVVVLNLENERGEVLAQVGKLESGRLIEQCQLPGAKQSNQQSPLDGIEQLLDHLSPLVGGSYLIRNEQKVECKASGTLGVTTRYLRDVHFAGVDSPPEQLPPEVPPTDKDNPPRHAIYGLRQMAKEDDFDLLAWLPRREFDDLVTSKTAKEVVSTWLRRLDLETLPSIVPESAHRVAKRLRKVDGIESTAVTFGLGANDCDNLLRMGRQLTPPDVEAGVTVTVVRALGLGCEDPDHLPHAYCKVCVANRLGDEAKTHTVRDTVDPVWDCQLRLPGVEAEDLLEFEVWDSFYGCESAGNGLRGLLGRAAVRLDAQHATFRGTLDMRLALEDGPEGGGLLDVRICGRALLPPGMAAAADGSPEGSAEPMLDTLPDMPPSSPSRSSRWEVQGWSVPDTPRPAAIPGEKVNPRRGFVRLQAVRAFAEEGARAGKQLSAPTLLPAKVWEPSGGSDEGAGASPGTWRDSVASYARMNSASMPEGAGQPNADHKFHGGQHGSFV